MKNCLAFCIFILASFVTLAQSKEKIFVTNESDIITQQLFGTYKTDGYYFYIVPSTEHLFEIRFEIYWYDWNLETNVVLDRCNGFVDFVKGKLYLTWNPCNNENSFQDIQIISYESLEFEFYKEDGDTYINFIGVNPLHKVD